MGDFLALIADLFISAYRADDRPEARRITIGCALMFFALIVGIVVLVIIGRTS
jgi:hypothetical protein